MSDIHHVSRPGLRHHFTGALAAVGILGGGLFTASVIEKNTQQSIKSVEDVVSFSKRDATNWTLKTNSAIYNVSAIGYASKHPEVYEHGMVNAFKAGDRVCVETSTGGIVTAPLDYIRKWVGPEDQNKDANKRFDILTPGARCE